MNPSDRAGAAATVSRTLPWLIFDGDCAFCTSSATWLAERLQRRGGPNVQLVPWQFTDLAALDLTPERTQTEAVLVLPDGRLLGGASAFAGWLRFRGGPYAVLGRMMDLPLIRSAAAAVYRLIARNRHRMPGGSPACALPPPGFDPRRPGTQSFEGREA